MPAAEHFDLTGRPGEKVDQKWFGGKGKTLGIVGLLLFIELFFYLIAVDNSPLIPGSLNVYETGMLFYLVTAGIALSVLGFSTKIRVIDGLGPSQFLWRFSVTAFAAWGLMTVVIVATGSSVSAVNDNSRIGLVVFTFAFIAPVEELTFRVAAPAVMPWWLGSVVMFAVYHIPAEFAIYGTANTTNVVAAVFELMIAGIVLWYIYKRFGFGSAVAAHGIYDAVLTGAIGVLPLSWVHLGLVPI